MPKKQLNPAYVEGVKGVLKSAPYFDLVSLELEDLLPGKAVFKIPAQQKHMNPFQRVHGGVFATIIDATTFWAIYSQVDDGLPMTTVELKINYLAPTVEGKTMIAYGNAVKVGKTPERGRSPSGRSGNRPADRIRHRHLYDNIPSPAQSPS
jgi:uncharacterized protein (TIGR00369 family)